MSHKATPRGWRPGKFQDMRDRIDRIERTRAAETKLDRTDLRPPCVEVRKSNIHGYGVFAIRDIQAGEFVCEFAGDIVNIPSSSNIQSAILNGTMEQLIQDMSHTYTISQDLEIRASPVPPIGPSHQVGQFVNDAECIDMEITDYPFGLRIAFLYTMYSLAKGNMVSVPCGRVVKFFSTRDVPAGTEMTYSYNALTWLMKCLRKPATDYTIVQNISTVISHCFRERFLEMVLEKMNFLPTGISPFCESMAREYASVANREKIVQIAIINLHLLRRAFSMLRPGKIECGTVMRLRFMPSEIVKYWPKWNEIPVEFFKFMYAKYHLSKEDLLRVYKGRLTGINW